MNYEELLIANNPELADNPEPVPVAKRGPVGEVLTGLERGVTVEVPRLAGQGMKWFSEPGSPVYETGEGLRVGADIRGADPDLELQPKAHGPITNSLAAGGEMLAPSLAPQLIAVVGDVLFPPAAPYFHAAAAGATGVGFGASQAQDSYERVLADTGDEAAAKKAGYRAGMVEGLGETVASAIGGKYITGALRFLGPKNGERIAARVLERARNPKALRRFGMATGLNAGSEVGTEMLQSSSQIAIEQAYGAKGGPSPGDAAVAAISPTLGMSALMIPFGGVGAYRANQQTSKMLNALEDSSSPVEIRAQAAAFFTEEIAQHDKPDADRFAAETLAAISEGKPFALSEPDSDGPVQQDQQTPTAETGPLVRAVKGMAPAAATPRVQRGPRPDPITGRAMVPETDLSQRLTEEFGSAVADDVQSDNEQEIANGLSEVQQEVGGPQEEVPAVRGEDVTDGDIEPSALSAFPEMDEVEGGGYALNRFAVHEIASFRKAGLVYRNNNRVEVVDAEKLWAARKKLQGLPTGEQNRLVEESRAKMFNHPKGEDVTLDSVEDERESSGVEFVNADDRSLTFSVDGEEVTFEALPGQTGQQFVDEVTAMQTDGTAEDAFRAMEARVGGPVDKGDSSLDVFAEKSLELQKVLRDAGFVKGTGVSGDGIGLVKRVAKANNLRDWPNTKTIEDYDHLIAAVTKELAGEQGSEANVESKPNLVLETPGIKPGDSFEFDGMDYQLESVGDEGVQAADVETGAVESWPSVEAFTQATGLGAATGKVSLHVVSTESVDVPAQEAATSPTNETPEPTAAQIEVGNYKKGHVRLYGLDISIENPAGSARKGVDESGKEWSTDLAHHYGYIKNTLGNDGDHLDVFIKPGVDQATVGDKVFVVDQKNIKAGTFDEHKILMGFDTPDAALAAYLQNYDDSGPQLIGAVTELSVDEFKGWIESGQTKKPLGDWAADKSVVPASKAVKLTVPVLNRKAKPLGLRVSKKQADGSFLITDRKSGEQVDRVKGGLPVVEVFLEAYGKKKLVVSQKRDSKPVVVNEPQVDENQDSPTASNEVAMLESEVPVFIEKGDDGSASRGNLVRMGDHLVEVDAINAEDRKVTYRRKYHRNVDSWEKNKSAAPSKTVGFSEFIRMTGVYPAVPAPSDSSTSNEVAKPEENIPKIFPEEKTPAYGGENKVFTADRAEKARELLRKKLSQLNAGVDPEMVQAGIELAGYHIEAGSRTFAAYSRSMVADLGEAIRPFLRSFYAAVRNYPGFDAQGMDSDARLDSMEAVAKVGAKAPKKVKSKGNDRRLQGDYGVASIDGYSDAGALAKENYLKDVKAYLQALKKVFVAEGWEVEKPSVSASSVAGSGSGTLIAFKPGSDFGAYVNIEGGMALPGSNGSPSGVRIMYRANTRKNKFTGLVNRWDAPWNATAEEMAGLMIAETERQEQPAENTAKPVIIETEQTSEGETDGLSGDSTGVSETEQSAGTEAATGRKRTGDVSTPDRDGVRESGDSSSEVDSKGAGVTEGLDRPTASHVSGENGKRAGRDGSDRVSPQPATGNYRITDADKLGQGGAKTKARANIAAIKLLKKIQEEARPATREEQAVLVKYVGWGASELANRVFPSKKYSPETGGYEETFKDGWQVMGKELRSLLSDAEYAQAKSSTRNAHYTSPAIIRGMYQALAQMGFAGGRILEPGAGIGSFVGLLPDSMASSRFTTIEMDASSAGIAQLLYPGHAIKHQDFTKFKAPHSFFDVAIGNPPFAQGAILSDPEYSSHKFPLHDYFFAKSIDRVRPGGLLMLVTSRYTMDKTGDAARGYMAKQADFLGAIRLPQTAFKENAGTDVVTDVIFLRKRLPGEKTAGEAWSELKEIKVGSEVGQINEYFADHPEMILGKSAFEGSIYGANQYTVLPKRGLDVETGFQEAIKNLPSNIYQQEKTESPADRDTVEAELAPDTVKEGGFFVEKGKLLVKEDGAGIPYKGAHRKKVVAFIPLRDAVRNVLYAQLKDNGGLVAAQKEMAKQYNSFVKQFGPLNLETRSERTDKKTGKVITTVRYPNFSAFRGDPDSYLVAGIERYSFEDGKASKADIFTKRVISQEVEPPVETVTDALHVSMHSTGKIDIGAIAKMMELTEGQVVADLGTAIFDNPTTHKWETADEYLSGNVRDKLIQAEAAAELEPAYARNVEALKLAQPEDLPPSKIKLNLGMPIVSPAHVEAFAQEVIEMRIGVTHAPSSGVWTVVAGQGGRSAMSTSDWGTEDKSAADLIAAALNSTRVTVMKTIAGEGGKDKRVIDKVRTEAANEKLQKIKTRFGTWVWEDVERSELLSRRYNDSYNNLVKRNYGGEHIGSMSFPGLSARYKAFDHQKRVAWRVVQTGNTYMAHSVGAGKTLGSILAGMELKRLGIKKKPMWVVPNHMLKQFASEFLDAYPAAKILVADEEQFSKANRNRFMGRVAADNWDGIIITHSAYKKMPLGAEYQEGFIQEQLEELEDFLREAKGDRLKVKKLEQAKADLQERLAKLLDGADKDKGVSFEDTGIDQLFIDEGHEFRKLQFATNQGNIKGIDSTGSEMAFHLYATSRYLESLYPGRSMVLMSGTPITNTMGEVYSIQRYLQEPLLRRLGLHSFDAWAASFGDVVTSLEAQPSGVYKPVTRFAKFRNMAALSSMWAEVGDRVHAKDLPELTRPRVEGGGRKLVAAEPTETLKAFKLSLAARIKKIEKRRGKVVKGDDIILSVISDGQLAALDDRYASLSAPHNPDSKLEKMLDNAVGIWEETAERRATQMIFADKGLPGMEEKRGFSLYVEIRKRLIERGVPAKEIAFMQDFKKSQDKLKLFKRVNKGEVRFLIGSSQAMGTGVNAQRKLVALHHMDPDTYLPSNIEQREGRIVRQGNEHYDLDIPVQLFAYVAKGSMDEAMWQNLASKQKFIDEFLAGDATASEVEDIDSGSDQFALAQALSSDNPLVLEKAGIYADIQRLESLEAAHRDDQRRMARVKGDSAAAIARTGKHKVKLQAADALRQDTAGDKFRAKVAGRELTERKAAGAALLKTIGGVLGKKRERHQIGTLAGFELHLEGQDTAFGGTAHLSLLANGTEVIETRFDADRMKDQDAGGLIRSLESAAKKIPDLIAKADGDIAGHKKNLQDASDRIGTEYEHKDSLQGKRDRFDAIEAELAAEAEEESGVETEEISQDTGLVVEDDRGDVPTFKVGDSSVAGAISDKEFNAVFDRITSGFEHRDAIVVAATAQALPARILAEIKKQGYKPDDVKAIFHSGKLYIVRDQMTSVDLLEESLFHEWHGHAGFKGMFGDELHAEMDKLFGMMKPGEMLRLSKKYGFKLAPYARGLRKAGYSDAKRHAILMEELLAFMTKEYSRGSIANKVREILGKIREWLRSHGFVRLAERNESDIAWLLKQARVYAHAGAWATGETVPVDGHEMLRRLKDQGLNEEALTQFFASIPQFSLNSSSDGVEYLKGLKQDAKAVKEGRYAPERIPQKAERREAKGGFRDVADVARAVQRTVQKNEPELQAPATSIPEGLDERQREQVAKIKAAEETAFLQQFDILPEVGFVSRWKKTGQQGGAEHKVIMSADGKTIRKAGSAYLNTSWLQYFNRLQLHNDLFPSESYKFKGFMEIDGQLHAVIDQRAIFGIEDATQQEIDTGLELIGFKKQVRPNHENKITELIELGQMFVKDDVILWDMQPKNVVKSDGRLYFIDPMIEMDPATKKRRILDELETQEGGDDPVMFAIREKEEKAFLDKLTPDADGLLFSVLKGKALSNRMKAAVGSVLSNPHYGSKKSPQRAKAYALALERGAQANEIKYEIMSSQEGYAGLEGVREAYRKTGKAEREMLDKLLVEGDINSAEFTEEQLNSEENPLGKIVPQSVQDIYRSFRETLDRSTEVMFDRLGRLRLLPYEGADFYDELLGLLDEGLKPKDVAWRFGINLDAMKAYSAIRRTEAAIDRATAEYREAPFYSTLRDLLLKGVSAAEIQNDYGLTSRDLVRAHRQIIKGGLKVVSAEEFRKRRFYPLLIDLIAKGDDHPMHQKLQMYNAYQGVHEYDSQLAKLKEQWRTAKGYLPRLRQDGEQHVKVFAVNEETGEFLEVWMQPARSELSADRLRKHVEKNLKEYIPHSFDSDADYRVVVEPNQATPEEIFLGIGSHRAIEGLLGKVFDKAVDSGVIEDQLLVQNQVLRILADEISARGFGRHRLARSEHLIEGYETENTPAILAQFIGSMAGWLSKSEFAMRANRLMTEIPSTAPSDKVWVQEYVDDALKNSTYLDQWAGTARGFAALWFLGFKVSSAMLNATQNYVWGQAVLSKYTKSATRRILKAQKDVARDHLLRAAGKPSNLTEEESWVMEEGARRGRTKANYVRAMAGMDDSGGVMGHAQTGLRWLTEKSMIPFQLVETYVNREPALLAGYRAFREQGMSKEEALKKAEGFVDDVHFVVGKENIPALLRRMGPLGRMLYTFQSYTHNYMLGMLTSLQAGEFAVVIRSITALVLFGGVAALPFGDDLDKWYRKFFGERPLRMLEKWLRETSNQYTDLGDQITDFVMHGAPGLVGVNFSNSLAVRMPWFSPDDDSLAERVTGVWGGMAQKLNYAAKAAAKGNPGRAAEFVSPEALANILRGRRLSQDGATTLSGRPLFDETGQQAKYSTKDAIVRGFGFMPLEPSKRSQDRWDVIQAKKFWQEKKSDLLAQYRIARTMDARKSVMKDVRQFNLDLRESPGGVLVPAINRKSLRAALKSRPNKRELAYLK